MPEQEQEQEQLVDWIDAEADSVALRAELQRLKRRAQKRPFLLLFICLLGVSTVLWKVSRRVPVYQASIVMRVTEGVVVDEESPVVRAGLANYLYTVALNSERLLPVIEKFDLFPEREWLGDTVAVEKLRDTLDIEVSVNNFARARDDGDPVRTAGVVIHFSNRDPDLAFNVASSLTAALVEAEQERRGQMAEKLNAIAGTSVQRVEERLTNLKQQLAETMIEVNEAKAKKLSALEKTRLNMLGRRLIAGVTQTEQVLERVSGIRDDTLLAIAAEGANQSLRFDVVDVRRPVIPPKKSIVAYILIGLVVFLCLVPVSAIGVAALDSRLHHIEDLVRLGLPVIGHMPSFPSDRMGSMQERSRQAKDVA